MHPIQGASSDKGSAHVIAVAVAIAGRHASGLDSLDSDGVTVGTRPFDKHWHDGGRDCESTEKGQAENGHIQGASAHIAAVVVVIIIIVIVIAGSNGDGRGTTQRPSELSAAVTLLGPGTGTTARPAWVAAATSRAPGSLIAGVPASLT